MDATSDQKLFSQCGREGRKGGGEVEEKRRKGMGGGSVQEEKPRTDESRAAGFARMAEGLVDRPFNLNGSRVAECWARRGQRARVSR